MPRTRSPVDSLRVSVRRSAVTAKRVGVRLTLIEIRKAPPRARVLPDGEVLLSLYFLLGARRRPRFEPEMAPFSSRKRPRFQWRFRGRQRPRSLEAPMLP